MRRNLLVLLACAMAACGDPEPTPPVDGTPDAAFGPDASQTDGSLPCANPCGASCCGANEVCDQGACKPKCAPESDNDFCTRLQKACGPVTAFDNCGTERTVASCGECPSGKTCDQTTAACVDVCVPESDDAFCTRLNKECGSFTGRDNCDLDRTVDCGGCGANQKCDANHCYEDCETDAAFCARMGIQCGSTTGTDNCGRVRNIAECGPCAAVETCVGQKCLLCVPESDAQFCARNGARCGTVSASDNCGDPRVVADCGRCGLPKQCNAQNLCARPGMAANDDCDWAQPIPLDATGKGSVRGDTLLATDGGDPSCNGGSGNDLVYAFTLTATKDVEIVATPEAGSAHRPNISVRQTCTDPLSELACARTGTTGTPSGVAIARLGAGTYYVFVDAFSSISNGAFTLSIDAHDPPPQSDDCLNAEAVTVDASGKAVVQGTTLGGIDDESGACGTFNGADKFYSISLATEMAVSAKVTSAGALKPAVYLRAGQCAGTREEKACAAGALVATVGSPSLPPGTYYIGVDGQSGTAGSFTLEVNVAPKTANDTCTAPKALTFDASGLATASGDTLMAADDSSGTCVTGPGRDLVYSFQTTGTRNIDITVTPTPGSMLQPNVYLRTACDATGAEYGCMKTTKVEAGRLSVSRLPAGTWHLWVDSNGTGNAGPFQLSVQLLPPPPPPQNDVCSGAEVLTITGGHATATGSTLDALDDDRGTCQTATDQFTGADVVYAFNLPAPSAVVARVVRDPADTGFQPAVYLRKACASAAPLDEAACAGPRSGVATASAGELTAGLWYVIVDGVNGSAGAFTLDLSVGTAITNDTCTSPKALTFDASGVARVSLDTTAARPDTNGSCGGSGGGSDVVYAFTLTTPKSFLATATPTAGSNLQPVLYLRTDCGVAASETGCARAASPAAAGTLTYDKLAPGTYYLWLDGYSDSVGPVDLEVALGALPTPSNDNCGATQALTFDPVTNTATVTGDTTYAVNDYNGTCATSLSPFAAADVVYALEVTTPSLVIATVSRNGSAGYEPAVYIRSACTSGAPADERACASSTGPSATASAANLRPGTYYVVVDGTTEGAFELKVKMEPAIANDTCAMPEELQFDALGVARVTADTSWATHDDVGTCNVGSTGKDVVYKFTTSTVKTLTAVLSPTLGSMQPNIYLRSACDQPSSEIRCLRAANQNPLTLSASRLPAGTWYLWVDGTGMLTNGPFSMTVTLADPGNSPANDLCIDAETIVFNGTTAQATGTTVNAGSDSRATCETASLQLTGGDVAYKFNLISDAKVTATVTRDAASTTYTPAVYFRRDCEDAATEMACGRANTTTATATAAWLTAGQWYVIVDGVSASSGGFTLDLALSAVIPNDTCLQPQELVPDATGVATVQASNVDATNDATASCGGSSGKDLVYTFTLGRPQNVDLKVTPATGSSFAPTLSLRTSCAAAASQLGCAYQSSPAIASQLYKRLPAGTYYVWVDAFGNSTGAFTLQATFTDVPALPANDECAGATRLVFDQNGKATVTGGDTSWAQHQYSGTCASSFQPLDGNDLVYSFEITTPSSVKVDLAPVTPPGYDPDMSSWSAAMYMRADSCTSSAKADEVFCTKSVYSTSQTASLGPGTYYVFIDGVSQSEVPFALTVTATALNAGDSCLNPTELAIDATTGTASASGTTFGAVNDNATGCYTGSTGPDVVYAFTLATEKTVTVSVTPKTGLTLKPNVAIRSNCFVRDVELACGYSSTAIATSVVAPRLAPGTYYVVVDSYGTATGPFDLQLTTADAPPPANDSCAGAAQINVTPNATVSVTGATTNATRKWSASCVDTAGAPDVAYTFTLTAPQKVVAKVTKDGTNAKFEPVVSIRRSCGTSDAADELTCAKPTSGVVSATANSLPAGTYHVIVDGANRTWGGFALDVTLSPVAAGPTNESCAAPQVLNVAGGSALVTGTTKDGQNEAAGTCSNATAADAVYAFTTTQDQKITARVVPGAGFWPSVYLRRACGGLVGGDELACTKAAATAAEAVAVTRRAPAGTYFVWVDGGGSTATSGDFSLEVILEAPTAPANNTCAGAEELVLGATVQGTTATADPSYGGLSAACGGKTAAGADVVYVYTPQRPGPFTVTVVPTGFDALLWATKGVCGQPLACMAFADFAGSGKAESVTLDGVAGTSYYFYVDGVSASGMGAFSISVQ